VNRAYEANQKVIQAEDSMLGTLINQVARLG
jgi:flagellar basal-body rod protein FlgG